MLVISVSGCAHDARVRVYVSLPERGGLVRTQADELVPYGSSQGFYCVPGSDLEILILEQQRKDENQ